MSRSNGRYELNIDDVVDKFNKKFFMNMLNRCEWTFRKRNDFFCQVML